MDTFLETSQRTKCADCHITFIMLIMMALIATPQKLVAEITPEWHATTTDLNLRYGPSTSYSKCVTVARGTELLVIDKSYGNWYKVVFMGDTLYASSKYLSYRRTGERTGMSSAEGGRKAGNGSSPSLLGILWTIVWNVALLWIFRWLLVVALDLFARFTYKAYWIVNLPFYFLNWLQRWLSKPWRVLYKYNGRYRDGENRSKRQMLELSQIPLYILLTPVRCANAFYYNIVVHVGLEMFNYVVEVILPSKESEGADNTLLWIVLIPWRILRYVVFHGTLTVVESFVWTAIDTFLPALTLFHGTSISASVCITQSPGRTEFNNWLTGVWNVGRGNYAGNGIYFAPERSTALHYSSGALIICRVTLGRVLDLGLAPYHVYAACGIPNALVATKWGLDNGYTTGEWWRGDRGWWEYCMYDWQNKYNESWRIRPLFVLNIDDGRIQRIPGGMHHWLFRLSVFEDFGLTLSKWSKYFE